MEHATRDFSRVTIKALAKRNIRIIGTQAVPAFDGDFSDVAYTLDDNGTHRVRRFTEVLAMAQEHEK